MIFKELILTVSILGGCGGLERTQFQHFLHWEAVVVLKELIFNSFYIGRLWWSSKNYFNSFYIRRVWWS